jgi:hypothetical protein
MIVVPRPSTVADLGLDPGPPRSTDRIHVSALIKAIMRTLEPDRFSGAIEGADWIRIEIGYALENAIEEAFVRRRIQMVRPGELECEGIVGSPDGLSIEDGEPIIEEIKCTWMSSRGCPEDKKFWHWLVQIKAYCFMAEALRARLHVFFVNGDYRDHREPQFLSWDLTFHQGELAENWMVLVNQKVKGV